MRQLERTLFMAGVLVCTALTVPKGEGQAQEGLTARTLYYNSGSDTQSQASTKPKRATRPSSGATATSNSTNTASATGNTAGSSTTSASTTPGATGGAPLPDTPTAPVTNLGVRYNVLLVDTSTNSSQPVDPSMNFRNNDCLALSVQSNYDGYLYVLDKGSSGKWDVLLPSAQLPDESNFVRARTNVRAPAEACFSLDNPPGVEHLYVVLARSPQDISELNTAVKNSRSGWEAGTGSEAKNGSIETQMARLEQGMHSRDLKITRVSKPVAANEPPHAVYVVDTSRTASDRIVTEIPIHHN